MHRRSAVTYVGADPETRARVSRAVDAAWDGSRVPDFHPVEPDRLLTAADDPDDRLLAGTAGVVTTARALTDSAVADRLTETPDRIPVIVLLEGVTVEAFRLAVRADADDVVADPEAASDPLVDRLAAMIEPEQVRFGSDDANRLREVLLDSGSTLMSTRSDEVDTKISWTMENVGETAELDRIVCYLRDSDAEAFDPAYAWCPDGCDPDVRSLAEFPDGDRLSTFENVVHSSSPAESSPWSAAGSDESRGRETEPPATVHVPLVADWDLVGVLAFETDAWRVWTDEEVALYRTFADLIAYTIARNDRRLELRRRTEQLEQFSAVVSHDLRNPLNVLSGYLEMVEGEVSPSTYEPMDRAVTRMETLIDNLLMLARRGETIGETEPTAVVAVAEEAWQTIRAPDATLTIEDDIGTVRADPIRLRQVFENLFRNAIDHVGPSVAIEIGTRTGDASAGMYVADDGPGIEPDVRDSLFDPGFSTADSSGIGLAIVERIVDAHGWDVNVRNDDGAVFELDFETEAAVSPA